MTYSNASYPNSISDVRFSVRWRPYTSLRGQRFSDLSLRTRH
ncbi:hypothetical protein [Carnimonas nigrificans]|nr:hypothetical protein [Carnimonas nigrificans]